MIEILFTFALGCYVGLFLASKGISFAQATDPIRKTWRWTRQKVCSKPKDYEEAKRPAL